MAQLSDPQNLKLSFHLSHELRAGNESRLSEIAVKIKGRIALASVSGAAERQFNERLNAYIWKDYIKPLEESEYDLGRFTDALKSIDYDGPVFLHTWGIKEPKPEVHLRASREKWLRLKGAK